MPRIPSAAVARRNAPDPRVLRAARQLSLAGLALVLVWPAARGYSQWVGWLPLWLLGMPLVAWWSLLRFPFPRLQRRRMQARRCRPRGRLAPLARNAARARTA